MQVEVVARRSLQIPLLEGLAVPGAIALVDIHVVHVDGHPYVGGGIGDLVVDVAVDEEVVGAGVAILNVVDAGLDKGKQGKVMSVDPKSQRAIVEGVRIISKHTRPNAEHPQGGIIKQEAPIHISNLMVVDNDGNPTRIGRKKDEKTGKLVRYSKKTGVIIK